MKLRKQAVVPGQQALLGTSDAIVPPPEWVAVQQALQQSLLHEEQAWQQFAACRRIEVYTDGSAPVRNPGGPAGFAALVVGFHDLTPPGAPDNRTPDARLDLAGYIPARSTDPQTSNNRAEMAGVLAALEALRCLKQWAGLVQGIGIWTDSDLVVRCAAGLWKRKSNTDLWPLYDQVEAGAKGAYSCPIELAWLKGHADHPHNEAADKLATQAALNNDPEQYARLRAAQLASGREMPGPHVLVASDGQIANQTRQVEEAHPSTLIWPATSSYTVALLTHIDRAERWVGPARGLYRVATRSGGSDRRMVRHEGQFVPDAAEYRTLIAALRDLLDRVEAHPRKPDAAGFSVTVYSYHDVVVRQLQGSYKVASASIRPLHAEALLLIQRFKGVRLIWLPRDQIEPLFLNDSSS